MCITKEVNCESGKLKLTRHLKKPSYCKELLS